MFLELPRTKWNDKKEAWEDEVLLINPFHVIAIEKDVQDARCSLLVMVGGVDYYIKHSPKGLRKKIDDFIKENVLSKMYKDIKDQSN
jgi:hypothetical protein